MKTKEFISKLSFYEQGYYEDIMSSAVEICEHDRKNQDEEEYLECIWEAIHQTIDDMCIYTHDCKKIIEDLDYDIFEEHPDFGKANSWEQGAYYALYNVIVDHGYEEYLKLENKI